MTRPERTLTLLDCIAIGINGIIGSGVYLLTAGLAKRAGPASVLAIFCCGLLCILIALCFAELSGMYDRSGGAYVYAREAFGPYVGFGVGWMSMATGVLGFAAVAVGFAEALSRLWPVLAGVKTGVAVALIATLGTINYLGVKAGARTSDALSVAKTLPLVGVALVGLFSIRAEVISGIFTARALPPGEAGAPGYFSSLANATFFAVFMLSGFEFTAVPAGEARNARRTIPVAIVGSLMGATLLYCVLQGVALSVLPDLATREQPLLDVAAVLFGPAGRAVLGVGALVSMAGFCAGSALVGPRYFTALADDGYLPPALAGLSRFGTPGRATLVCTSLSALLAFFLGYRSLVDVSNVALFAQYIPTSLAVLVLRRRLPAAPRTYRLPLGPAVPLLAASFSALLLLTARPRTAEWLSSGLILVAGAGVWGASAALRGRAGVKPAEPPGGG